MKNKFLLISVVCVILSFSGNSSAQEMILSYSTYLGGNEPDSGYGIAVESTGDAYITGNTFSFNFPTKNSYQAGINAVPGPSWYSDVFVSKLSSDGSRVIYSTYLGGELGDSGSEIAVEDGCAFVTGHTASPNFPTEDPYQASLARDYDYQEDLFVFKLDSSGSSLLYSTYLGGWYTDNGEGIRVRDGVAYVAGWTYSTDFPVVSAYQTTRAGTSYNKDAFLTVLSESGSALISSGYLGGEAEDVAEGIALGNGPNACLVGYTWSSDFPVTGFAYQTACRREKDSFICKFSSTGTALLYSTYLGGSNNDTGFGISVEGEYAYLAGYTESTDFPLVNAYQTEFGEDGFTQAFIGKLSSSGSGLVYSTYLGGGGDDYAYGVEVENGFAYATGYTESTDFPVINAYQSAYGLNEDVFVSKISSTGSELLYSTYLGGSGRDWGYGISIVNGSSYLTGYTESPDFPTENPYQAAYDGGTNKGDAFVAKLIFLTPIPSVTPTSSPIPTPSPTTTNGGTRTPPPASPTPSPTATNGGTRTPTPVPLSPSPTLTPAQEAPPWITDFNGDGTSDPAIFRDSSGLWAVRGITRIYFGAVGDSPEPGDYDGDGTTDIGLYRFSSGLWAVRNITRAYFGGINDHPCPGDFDGDGTDDIGIYRSSSGLWALRGITRTYFGRAGDQPVPAYYSGMEHKEIAIFRPVSGLWSIRKITRIYFGASNDEVVPGNYGKEGACRPAIWRPSSGLWAVRGLTRCYFGSSSDLPVPGDYSGTGTDRIGIFRPVSGLWAIKGVSRIYYGSAGDIPVTR